jgi:hypothetical protein
VLVAAMFSLFCRNFDLNEDDDMEDDEYDPLVVEEAADQWPPASGIVLVFYLTVLFQIFHNLNYLFQIPSFLI